MCCASLPANYGFWSPVDTVEKLHLRPISPRSKLDEATAILQGLTRTDAPWEENWNKRYRMNMDKIKSGDICQLPRWSAV